MIMINFFLLNLPDFLGNDIKLTTKMASLCPSLVNTTRSFIGPTRKYEPNPCSKVY